MLTENKRVGVMNVEYIRETPAEIAKAMSIMGGWMFLWTGALLLLIFL